MSTSSEGITFSASCLTRNYEKTLALLEEIIMEPRWDDNEFDLIIKRTLDGIKKSAARPGSVARNAFKKILYGEKHILAYPTSGTLESVVTITMNDLKYFYDKNFSPSIATFKIAGFIDKERVRKSLESLTNRWKSKEVMFPEYDLPQNPKANQVYFIDVEGAKQSVIRIGKIAHKRSDKNYVAAMLANYRLGSGTAGRLFQILREEKSYTYGAGSGFAAGSSTGTFVASSSVRTDVTLESAELFKSILGDYQKTYTEDDLMKTKSAILKSNARQFETIGRLMGVLSNIADNGLDIDYLDKEQTLVKAMTDEQMKKEISKNIDPSKMIYIVVGDKKTQKNRLRKLGFG